jgi:hypothetical protein
MEIYPANTPFDGALAVSVMEANFLTEQQFIKRFGDKWRFAVPNGWDHGMDHLMGRGVRLFVKKTSEIWSSDFAILRINAGDLHPFTGSVSWNYSPGMFDIPCHSKYEMSVDIETAGVRTWPVIKIKDLNISRRRLLCHR